LPAFIAGLYIAVIGIGWKDVVYLCTEWVSVIIGITMGHFATRWFDRHPAGYLVKHANRYPHRLGKVLRREGPVRTGNPVMTEPVAGITYRYPNMGWWLIHLAAVSFVYYLGNRLWSCHGSIQVVTETGGLHIVAVTFSSGSVTIRF
jgi:hypothetical protein